MLICNLSSLLPLVFIGCIPDEDPLAEVATPPRSHGFLIVERECV